MKGICVQELDALVPCALVSGDDDETRGKVGEVLQLLAWRGPSCVYLQYLHECGGEGREGRGKREEGERQVQMGSNTRCMLGKVM